MKLEDLKKIGLSHSEATLYLVLFRLGTSSVKTLIEETGFYKSNAYEALERLCEKGIVSKIIENGKRFYQIQKPETFLELINKKKYDLEKEEEIATKIIKDVENIKKQFNTTETASVFRGIAGVKQIYSEIINSKLDYLVFGSPKESETVIGDYYWQNLHLKQKEFKIKAKMIFHKSLRNWEKIMPKNVVELRFLDEEFEPLTETTVYGKKVAFVVWTDNPVVTIINNEHVANSYRQLFNLLWKNAKK